MKSRIPAAVLVVLALLGGRSEESAAQPVPEQPAPSQPSPAAGAAAQLAPELDAIVDTYRKIIVLTSDEASLPVADRETLVFMAGKLLYDRNQPRLELLQERLAHDLDTASSVAFRPAPALVEAFLDQLESQVWRDADKLVFHDLVGELARHLAGLAPRSPVGKALVTRLGEDVNALDEIRALYDGELQEIFSRFQTRGMPVTREAWDDYLDFLRGLHSAASVLEAMRDELSALSGSQHGGRHGGTRGSAPPASSRPAPSYSGRGLPSKTLVLTFDDGPHPRYTEEILEILERFGVKSIFFKVGRNVARLDAAGEVKATRSAEESRKVRAAGHLVAHHSYSHAVLPKLDAVELGDELDLTTRMLEEVVGVKPDLFRPPYGALSDGVRAAVGDRDMRIMLWNIDSRDWADPVPRSIANRVIAEVRDEDRGVVLFHDIQGRTVAALPLVLETLQAEGFRFVLWDGEEILEGPAPAGAEASAGPLTLYRESFAVVIGIDAYTHWPRLAHAAADARAFRDLLVERFDWKSENVFLLIDGEATRERILEILGDTLADVKRVSPDDRVIVFFAGHGTTRALASGRQLGYIVPVDAPTEKFHAQAISMTMFQDINDAIPAKHLFYLMDACYGGLALTRGGPQSFDPAKYLREVTSRPARQMLTAGGADEEVADGGPGGHSIFTWTILQGLEGLADLNGDRHITATELFTYAGPLVAAQSRQTPAFGNLVGSGGGELVFALKEEDHFLSELSEQLDDEAIRLDAELADYREEIQRKRERNRQLAAELKAARAELAAAGAPSGTTPLEEARDLINQGLVLYREKKLEAALELFLEAARLEPSNVLAANNVGFAYYKLERYAEALEWYEKTLALDPERAVAHLNAGETHEKLGRREAAIAAYRRFLELAPNHAGAEAARERLKRLAGLSGG